MIELVEEIDVDYPHGAHVERWFARVNGEPRGVLVVRSSELAFIERAMRARCGAIHARVGTVHDVIRRDGELLWVVVDDERGPPLGDAAAALADPDDRERWSVAQIIGLAEACAALRAREITPVLGLDDVFVDIAGHARLRAGLATPPVDPRTLTRSGPMPNLRRMAMMTPEHVAVKPVGPASDVFSLASNLAYALTGALPFQSESAMAMLVMILQVPPAPVPTLAPGLDRVLTHALEKDPAARYPDAAAFADALRACVPDAHEYDQVISDRIVAWRAAQ